MQLRYTIRHHFFDDFNDSFIIFAILKMRTYKKKTQEKKCSRRSSWNWQQKLKGVIAFRVHLEASEIFTLVDIVL